MLNKTNFQKCRSIILSAGLPEKMTAQLNFALDESIPEAFEKAIQIIKDQQFALSEIQPSGTVVSAEEEAEDFRNLNDEGDDIEDILAERAGE